MNVLTPHTRHAESSRRLLPLVTVVPYVLLAILTGVTVVVRRSHGDSFVIDLGLCAVTAAWMLWMFTLHPAWRERPRVMGLFLAVLIARVAVRGGGGPGGGGGAPAGGGGAGRRRS